MYIHTLLAPTLCEDLPDDSGTDKKREYTQRLDRLPLLANRA